jgi:hypothetical protein
VTGARGGDLAAIAADDACNFPTLSDTPPGDTTVGFVVARRPEITPGEAGHARA